MNRVLQKQLNMENPIKNLRFKKTKKSDIGLERTVTQIDMASIMGISQGTLAKIEAGIMPPPNHSLERLRNLKLEHRGIIRDREVLEINKWFVERLKDKK